MKKKVQTMFILCLILSATTSHAQITAGLRAGVNLATYNYTYGSSIPASNQPPQPQSATLLTVGIPVQVPLSQYFVLQMELNYIQKGFQSKSDATVQTTRFVSDSRATVNWLELPILVKTRFGSDIGIGGGLFFGPSIAYGLSGNSKFSLITTTITNGTSTVFAGSKDLDFKEDDHSRVDFCLNLGGEANYGGIFLDVRYQIGLTNMATNTSGSSGNLEFTAKTRGLALTAGYRFLIAVASKPSKVKKK